MRNDWIQLIFSLEKKYSFPILFLLYSKKELSFDQLYNFCSQYKHESGVPTKRGGTALRDAGTLYKAISRESISRAAAELQKKKYVRKEAKLSKQGRPYAIYVLTDETKQLISRHLKQNE